MKADGERVAITNIGKIVSGDIKKGVLEGNTILIENGTITEVGSDLNFSGKGRVIDANRQVVIPGLIDAHTHPFLEDYSPITKTVGWMETSLLGGTTSMLSATTFTSGMVLDPDFLTHMAILAETKYRASRPGGFLKLHAGTVVLAPGLTEAHFKAMAENGVHLLSEIGCMGLARPKDIKQMLNWARQYKMIIPAHFGGRTVIGSSSIPVRDMYEIDPDVVAHVNGGSTAASLSDTFELINETEYMLEVNFHGNIRVLHEVMKALKAKGQLSRVILGSDMPVGTGLEPLVMLRLLSQIASVNEIPAEQVIACATGNTADLVRANTGKIEVGREADLLIIDRPPESVGTDALGAIEAGDTVGTNLVMVDGQIVTLRGRDTRPTATNIRIDGIEQKMEEMPFDEWCFGR